MLPGPGPYIPLVLEGNALLRRLRPPRDPAQHPAFRPYSRVRFTHPDGEVSPGPLDWLQDLEEFRARRLSLVLFRVVDPEQPEHLVVEEDPGGVWGLQVEYPRRTLMWLAGADGGTLDFHGQPTSGALSKGPPVEEAAAELDRACRFATTLARERAPDLTRTFGRMLDLLHGPLPEAATFGEELPESARRLGEAGLLGGFLCQRATREEAVKRLAPDPDRSGPVASALLSAVAGALAAATNASGE